MSNQSACRDIGAIILCGGLGTRLREESEFKPKPMLAIGGKPILWHIMKIYGHFGVRDFHLCLGYKAEVIKEYFLQYRLNVGHHRIDLRNGAIEAVGPAEPVEDWRVTLVDTGVETLTGTRVKRALEVIDGDRFFLTYGDGVADIDIAALLRCHEASGRLFTITAVRPSSRFGELDLDGDRIRAFKEKPQVGAGWINGGFMVFERKAFDFLPLDDNSPLETVVLERLCELNQVSVYRHDSYWQCMDTYREMQLLESQWRAQRAPWRIWND